jgi:hypothetical protein
MPNLVDEEATSPLNVDKQLQLTGSDICLESSAQLLIQPHVYRCDSLTFIAVTASSTSL